MARRRTNPRVAFLVMAATLAFATFLPARWTGWLQWFRGPLMAVIAPISGPLTYVSTWLRPGDSLRDIAVDPEINELRLLSELYKTEFLRADQENQRLRSIIEALQQGIGYGATNRIRLLEATRVGSSAGAGTIDVAKGSVHGVLKESVATAIGAPQHLVGLVSTVGTTVSAVHLITDRHMIPRLIEALILKDEPISSEGVALAPRCQFKPVGDGTLEGVLGAQEAQKIQKGDLAYLDDDHWPDEAQRLVLARVIRIEETDKPLFRKLILRPDFDLARVRGVILRIRADSSAPSGGTP